MQIEEHWITVREVVDGYVDNAEEGVFAHSGKLNIRPPYQREYVYEPKRRDAVIDTIAKGYPLNVFYWAVNDDGTYELLDGQQRTVSFCQYYAGAFSVDRGGVRKGFANLTPDEKDQFLDYKLLVYTCKGTDSEKLEWFEIVNEPGLKLTPQELLNAVYTGPWLSDAKAKFSKPGGPAYGLASKYLTGKAIRQAYLETALKWISGGEIDAYMAAHQHDPNANELWTYFRNVIEWVQDTFTTYRSEMKGVAWGPIYDNYGRGVYDTDALEERVAALMADDDITRPKGIYPYVFDGDERHLNIRQFTSQQRRQAFERQNGLCANGDRCIHPGNEDGTLRFELEQMEADHITPWSKNGKTSADNCQMLCRDCNRRKANV